MKGIIYQAISNSKEANNQDDFLLIDFASDGARSFEMLKNHGDEQLFEKLIKDGWKSEEDREKLIELTVRRIEDQKPSIIFLTDTLFWDTVPRALYYAKQKGMNSTLLNILNNPLLTNKLKHTRFYGFEQEQRMHDDFFEAVARISRGHYNGTEIPVVMARLVDNPAAKYVSSGVVVDFAKIVASVIYQISGINLKDKMIASFGKVDLEDLGYNPEAELDYFETKEFSEGQIAKVQDIFSQNSSLPGKALTRLSGPVVKEFTKSLPLILSSLDKSFAHMNFLAREFAFQNSNNVTMVSADDFFLDIHNLLHPGTIHPHIEGSKEMANLVERATCSDQILRTDAIQYGSENFRGNYKRYSSQRFEIHKILEHLVYEKQSKTFKMSEAKFDLTPLGWTKKDGVTTLKGRLQSNNIFTSNYAFEFELSYDKFEILDVKWADNKDTIARQAALSWLDSIKYHLPEYLVY